ncbi:vascular cell adhesion protein 1-like [Stegastes partitus]|uniref:Vascular cell adhesion protein 1-like n=2 Tax=Stegastes partitus TaxID=144197 RepID=A0A9Y4NQ50_9TELE|nr:PREDICTED: vascular cell adhesion protein 1-like [Stegastes partitus]
MSASGWPITLLLVRLFGSATSSPVSMYTPAPTLPSQISPPLPTSFPFLPSPSLSVPSHIPPFISSSAESTERLHCPLTMSPSTLVVRFGDPVKANCSIPRMGFSALGWEVSSETAEITVDRFKVWSVKNLTVWSINVTCFALSEHGGQCNLALPVIIYQPPDRVSITLVNHTGPMFEGYQYTLQCTVQDVAPVENLVVTFYRGDTALGQVQSNNTTERTPVTEIFTLGIIPTKEDNGAQYWCDAKLELGPEGPQHPPVVTSQKLSATVLFGPQLSCPTKLQVREGESLKCNVTGNPEPSVTWIRDGQVIVLPNHSSRAHAGKYIVWTEGFLGQKNFTVEVEVLAGSGTANTCNGHFLLAVLVTQMIHWL